MGKLTQENIAHIEHFIELYEAGGTKAVIEAGFGSLVRVKNCAAGLQFLGIECVAHRSGRPKKINADLARRLRAEGVSDADIAKHFGVTREAVRHRLGRRRQEHVPLAEALARIEAEAAE